MIEKAKGVVTHVEKKTSAAGKDYFFATIGQVKFLFFDSKIQEKLNQEIEIEYTTKVDDKGTTFFGNFPGQAKTSSPAPRKGSSPEELKQKAIDMKLRTKTMCFSYGKDAANHLHPQGTTKEEYWATMDFLITRMLEKCAGNIKELGE
jgi:hypothetical protein